MDTTNRSAIDYIKSYGLDGSTKSILDECSLPAHVTYKSLSNHLARTYQKYQHLNKSRNRVKGKYNFERFMNASFSLPKHKDVKSINTNNMPTSSELFHSNDDPNLKAQAYQAAAEE
ncbi:hypothetical protein DPMN_168743 [Dreissena polymorpha]|uniref:Uncharacterized protein n=1 Tax=Dreissena polymorpha TaxID=45954 RepID=A0A9D4F5Q1_DREPO|nr:hypothetical protein DPMN_168743 [Dreissena polymorpha]